MHLFLSCTLDFVSHALLTCTLIPVSFSNGAVRVMSADILRADSIQWRWVAEMKMQGLAEC